jgi:hypothetical protein
MSEREVFVPFPGPLETIGSTTRVRSTLIASSLRSLREHGHFDAYFAKLEPAWRDAILHSVAGVWMPVGAGTAHYRACDALQLSPVEQIEIGREVGDRIQGTFLASMVRAARGAGVTPWRALSYTDKLYGRLFEGGGMAVVKLGPKEARVDMANNPIVGVGYFRNGLRGLYQVAVELFCTKAYVTNIPNLATETSCALKISWA